MSVLICRIYRRSHTRYTMRTSDQRDSLDPVVEPQKGNLEKSKLAGMRFLLQRNQELMYFLVELSCCFGLCLAQFYTHQGFHYFHAFLNFYFFQKIGCSQEIVSWYNDISEVWLAGVRLESLKVTRRHISDVATVHTSHPSLPPTHTHTYTIMASSMDHVFFCYPTKDTQVWFSLANRVQKSNFCLAWT